MPSPFGKPANEDVFEFEFPAAGSGSRIEASDDYIGKCISVTKSVSKSGNDMLVWGFVVTKGPHSGRDFTLYTALTPAAMWKVAETMLAFGVEGEEGDKMRIRAKDLIGVSVRMRIVDDEYNGRPTSKIDGVLPHPKGAGYRSGTSSVSAQVTGQEEGEEDEEEPAKVRKAAKRDEEEPPKRRGAAKSRL